MRAKMPPTTRRHLLSFALRTGAAAIAAPALVRRARATTIPRFALGVASGFPRPDGMVLWTRLTGAGLPEHVDVQWEIAHDESFTRIAARGTEVAEGAWAHSVHAEPRGLDPGRWYHYRFHADGQASAAGRTRTAPPADAPARLKFAVASCQRYDHNHYAAWRDAAEFGPDLVLFLGDYIYEYASPPEAVRRHEGGAAFTLAQYRDRYATYKSDPLLQAAHAAAPWALVWDDHEVANDYAALLGQERDGPFAARRAAAYRAYWEHQPFPKSARPAGPDMRIYGHLDWGRLARIHLLDDRQYRDLQACQPASRARVSVVRASECRELGDPKRSILGAAQERWLADGWSPDRPWNLVAQQTIMSRFAWGGSSDDPALWTDGWDGYGPARARVLGTAAARGVGGLVVLGGDVHAHFVSPLKLDYGNPKSPAMGSEFCSTSIASRGVPQWQTQVLMSLNPHLVYGRSDRRGSVQFGLDAKSLQADLRGVDDALDPASAVRSLARFVVEAGSPGPLPA
jgi:alkaline phosphatase D